MLSAPITHTCMVMCQIHKQCCDIYSQIVMAQFGKIKCDHTNHCMCESQ